MMWLKTAIENCPSERIALEDDVRCIFYGEILNEIEKYQSLLHDVKVLGIALDNSVEWILWDLAALMSGVPCVPIPPFFSSQQIEHTIQTANITHLISDRGLQKINSFDVLNILPERTVKVTFTSGTTANPKGVCLSQQALENVSTSIASMLGENFINRHICVLPLSILLENIAGVYTALLSGCTITIPSLKHWGNNYENMHLLLQRYKAESLILVPELLKILIEQTKEKGLIDSLIFIAVGGAKLDPDLIKEARSLGLPVYEGYGLSEAGSVVSMNTPLKDKIGTTGSLLPHVQFSINQNELCLKNQGFLGYIGETVPMTIQTGDIADFDGEFLSILGRKKNIIITSLGRNISPEWVESILTANSLIKQAIVYGEAESFLRALIVTDGLESEIRDVIEKCNQSLPSYAHVKSFQIVSAFTVSNGQLTGNGRPKRNAILSTYIYKKEKENEILRQIG